MSTLPLRLRPGEDLRDALEAVARAQAGAGLFVLAGIGSLSVARLRLAGAAEPLALEGDIEVLCLAGSIAGGRAHLHAALALADGRVLGGHLGPGCTVRTTAEILLAVLPRWPLARRPDPDTGYDELWVPGTAPR